MELLMHYLLLCAATAMCAMTISKMKVAAPLHDLAAKLGQVWLQDLLTCPYCLSVWFGLFWVVVTQSVSGLVPTVFMALAVSSGAVIFGGAMYRILMLHEKEVYALKEKIKVLHSMLSNERENLADAEHEVLRLRNTTRVQPPFSGAPLPPLNGFTPPRPMPPATPPVPEQTGDNP